MKELKIDAQVGELDPLKDQFWLFVFENRCFSA